MDNILETIEIINQLTTDLYFDITKVEGKEYYLNGGCYELSCILKQIYPESNMYIRYDKSHIVTEINGHLYDANGYVTDINNYSVANNFDIQYIQEYSNNFFKHIEIAKNILIKLGIKENTKKFK